MGGGISNRLVDEKGEPVLHVPRKVGLNGKPVTGAYNAGSHTMVSMRFRRHFGPLGSCCVFCRLYSAASDPLSPSLTRNSTEIYFMLSHK